MTMKTTTYCQLAEWCTVKILCPFQTSGCGVPQKNKHFGINIYKLCDMSGYICLLMEGQDISDHRHDRNTGNCKSIDKNM
jgi:hypothetical protein